MYRMMRPVCDRVNNHEHVQRQQQSSPGPNTGSLVSSKAFYLFRGCYGPVCNKMKSKIHK